MCVQPIVLRLCVAKSPKGVLKGRSVCRYSVDIYTHVCIYIYICILQLNFGSGALAAVQIPLKTLVLRV